MRDTLDRLVTWAVLAYLAYAVVAIGLWIAQVLADLAYRGQVAP